MSESLRDMDRMRERSSGRGEGQSLCVCEGWFATEYIEGDGGVGGLGRGTGVSSKILINLLCFEEEIVEGVHVDIASSGSSSQKTCPLPEIIDNEITMTL